MATTRKTFKRDANLPSDVGTNDRDAGRPSRKSAGRAKAGAPERDAAMRQGIDMSADGHQHTTIRRPRKMGPDGIAGAGASS